MKMSRLITVYEVWIVDCMLWANPFLYKRKNLLLDIVYWILNEYSVKIFHSDFYSRRLKWGVQVLICFLRFERLKWSVVWLIMLSRRLQFYIFFEQGSSPECPLPKSHGIIFIWWFEEVVNELLSILLFWIVLCWSWISWLRNYAYNEPLNLYNLINKFSY